MSDFFSFDGKFAAFSGKMGGRQYKVLGKNFHFYASNKHKIMNFYGKHLFLLCSLFSCPTSEFTTVYSFEFGVIVFYYLGDWDSTVQNISTGSEESSVTLRGLRPARTYFCRVRAENSVGLGDPSEAITVVTMEEGQFYTLYFYFIFNLILSGG